MATGNEVAEVQIKMVDEVSGAADSASSALAQLRRRIDDDTKSLAAMTKAMKNMQGASSVDIALYRKLKSAIDEKRGSLGKAQAGYLELGGDVTKTAGKMEAFAAAEARRTAKDKAASAATMSRTAALAAKQKEAAAAAASLGGQFDTLASQAQGLGGPLGAAAGMLARLKAIIVQNPMTIALIASAAAFALLTVAAVKAGKALYEYAFAQANARRAELLRLEGLSKIRNLMTMSRGLKETSGADMQRSIDRVSASVSIARDKVAGFNSQLYQMGLRGKQLDSALEGMSIKAAAQGDGQASLFAGWAQYYALSGRAVDKLTDKVKSRLGGIVKRQMLDADVQAQKLEESYGALFRGINIEPLLKAKKAFNDIFSQSTASGRMLTKVFSGIAQTLIDGMTKAQGVIKHAMLSALIAVVKLEIKVIQLRKALATSDYGKAFEILATTATSAASAVGGYILKLTTSFLKAAAKFYVWALSTLGATFLKIGLFISGGWLNVDWMKLGRAVWQGIVNGLREGLGPLKGIMGEIATIVRNAFAGALDMHSPSKVFAKLGAGIPAGIALGIKAGQSSVDAAMKAITPTVPVGGAGAGGAGVPLPAAGGGNAGGPDSSTKRGGAARTTTNSVSIQNLHVHVGGEGGEGKARDIAKSVKSELERILQGVAIEMGARDEGSPA